MQMQSLSEHLVPEDEGREVSLALDLRQPATRSFVFPQNLVDKHYSLGPAHASCKGRPSCRKHSAGVGLDTRPKAWHHSAIPLFGNVNVFLRPCILKKGLQEGKWVRVARLPRAGKPDDSLARA